MLFERIFVIHSSDLVYFIPYVSIFFDIVFASPSTGVYVQFQLHKILFNIFFILPVKLTGLDFFTYGTYCLTPFFRSSVIYFKVLFFLLLYWLNIVVIIVLTTAEPNKMLIPEVSSPITSFSSRLSVLVLFHL